MAYIYQADIYCTSCGEKIKEELTKEGKAPENPDNEYTYNSDDFPKYADDNEESDSPQHCGCHENCLEAITLPSGRKIGAPIGQLTEYGVQNLKEMIEESPSEVTTYWQELYKDYLS